VTEYFASLPGLRLASYISNKTTIHDLYPVMAKVGCMFAGGLNISIIPTLKKKLCLFSALIKGNLK